MRAGKKKKNGSSGTTGNGSLDGFKVFVVRNFATEKKRHTNSQLQGGVRPQVPLAHLEALCSPRWYQGTRGNVPGVTRSWSHEERAVMSSDGSLEPIGDIVVWVDTTLRETDTATSQPTNSNFAAVPFNSMGSFVEGPAGAIDVPEMERRNMSLAECEQCALDDFWGMVANQVEQAEATVAMEREDQRSQDVRARIKKEERYKIWEEEDLRKRETRSVVRENLEDAARREYLEARPLF